MIDENDTFVDKKETRTNRWLKSAAARMRRKFVKDAKAAHLIKDDHDSLERIKAKRLLEKQKKSRKKINK